MSKIMSKFKMEIKEHLVTLFDSICMHTYIDTIAITPKFITQFVYRILMTLCRPFQLILSVNWFYIARTWAILNYNKHFIWLFDSTYWIPLCCHSNQHTFVTLSSRGLYHIEINPLICRALLCHEIKSILCSKRWGNCELCQKYCHFYYHAYLIR